MKNQCGDCGGVAVQMLDLSGLPYLESINLSNVDIQVIKLNNADFDLTNLTLNLYHAGFPGNDFTQTFVLKFTIQMLTLTTNHPTILGTLL